MKRVFCLLLALLTVFSVSTTAVFAEDDSAGFANSYVEYMSDVSYYVVTLQDENPQTRGTKSGSKSISFFNSQDVRLWTVVVHGTFNYTGTSATCTASSTTYTIYDSKWRVTSAVASKSGNTATGTFTVKRYTFGIPVQTENVTKSISCSATGVLS